MPVVALVCRMRKSWFWKAPLAAAPREGQRRHGRADHHREPEERREDPEGAHPGRLRRRPRDHRPACPRRGAPRRGGPWHGEGEDAGEHEDEEPQHEVKGHTLGDDEIGQLIHTVDDEEEGQHAHGQRKGRATSLIMYRSRILSMFLHCTIAPWPFRRSLGLSSSSPSSPPPGPPPAADRLERFREIATSRWPSSRTPAGPRSVGAGGDRRHPGRRGARQSPGRGPYASAEFIRERLDSFGDAWAGLRYASSPS